MRDFRLKSPLLTFLALAAWIVFPAIGQERAVKTIPVAPTTAIDGPTLYKQYCAVCHGTDGKGAGPAAGALKIAPSDLTAIARKNGGHFPEERFFAILHGQSAVAAHGSPDMPMWGPVFQNMSSSPTLSQTRMHALLEFVERIQVK